MNPYLQYLIQPIIVGIFSLLSIWLTNRLQNTHQSSEVTENQVIPSQEQKVIMAKVMRDVFIIFLLTGLLGMILALVNDSKDGFFSMLTITNPIVIIIGFVISGSLVVGNRWKHLFIVAIVFWLFSYMNVIFGLFDFLTWVKILGVSLLEMGIGGGISYMFKSGYSA